MEISVIVIGDELLIGQVNDTNSGFIARTVAPAGWTVKYVEVVHDDATQIREAVERALQQTPVVITTGGLGPTKDDITRNTLMEIFGGRLVWNAEVAANVERVFAARHLKMNTLTASQAMVPDTCRVLPNDLGTAPIMWFERDGRVVVSMPGVPFETEHAFRTHVFPALLSAFGERSVICHETLVISGITESDLAELLSDRESALPAGMHYAYLPNQGYIRLRIDAIGADAESTNRVAREERDAVAALLGSRILATEDLSPEQILVRELKNRGLSLSTAESCTGGNIAHRLTLIPGVSEWYAGTVVSYSNEVKERVLGVCPETLAEFGAVSEQVARQMAEGASARLGTDCAVATSGIAGPGGGTPEKPVGTVCMAFVTPRGTFSHTFRFPGDRNRVITRASSVAMLSLAALLRESGKIDTFAIGR